MEGRTPSSAPHLPFPVIPLAPPPPRVPRDVLNVGSIPGVEPEAQPVERVHAIGVALTWGGRALTGGLAEKRVDAAVAEDYGSAGKLAMNLKSRCATCVNFNRERAKPYIEAAINKMKQGIPLDSRGCVRGMVERRAAWSVLVQREEIIKRAGVCDAITEAMSNHNDGALRAPWLVDPDGGCPAPAQLRGPGGEDLSQLYKERERPTHAKSPGTVAYDKIMHTAAGKKE